MLLSNRFKERIIGGMQTPRLRIVLRLIFGNGVSNGGLDIIITALWRVL